MKLVPAQNFIGIKIKRTIDRLSVYGGGSGISMIIQLLITHHFLPKIIDCLNFLLLFY